MLIPEINKKEITKTSYSDIVRLFLLEKYGGCWCDATTFCNKSLDSWLNACINDGFFAFDRPNRMDRLILSSWFLYSDKSSYIIKRWRDETIEYWNKNNKMNNYFWCHLLFNELYNTDIKFKKIWDDVGKIDTRIPHYIQERGFLKCVCDNVKNHIKECRAPMYKLTYKFNMKEYNEDCNLAYLLK